MPRRHRSRSGQRPGVGSRRDTAQGGQAPAGSQRSRPGSRSDGRGRAADWPSREQSSTQSPSCRCEPAEADASTGKILPSRVRTTTSWAFATRARPETTGNTSALADAKMSTPLWNENAPGESGVSGCFTLETRARGSPKKPRIGCCWWKGFGATDTACRQRQQGRSERSSLARARLCTPVTAGLPTRPVGAQTASRRPRRPRSTNETDSSQSLRLQ